MSPQHATRRKKWPVRGFKIGPGRALTTVAVTLLGVFLMVAALTGSKESIIEAGLIVLALICFAGAVDVLRGH